MKLKLKPCPFCGQPVRKIEVYRGRNEDIITAVIRCENTVCCASTVFECKGVEKLLNVSEDGIDESVKLCATVDWNRRAE